MIIIDGKEYYVELNEKKYHCAVDVTMNYIGGKWKSVVLWYLKAGTQRFSELKKNIPGITERMLAKQLRELEKDGIIIRKVYPEVPPKVEYRLSDNGKKLLPVIDAIAEWGKTYSNKYGKMVEKSKGVPALSKLK